MYVWAYDGSELVSLLHKQHKRQNAVGKLANPGAGAGEGAALALRALTAVPSLNERMTTLLACWLSRTRMSRGWRRA